MQRWITVIMLIVWMIVGLYCSMELKDTQDELKEAQEQIELLKQQLQK